MPRPSEKTDLRLRVERVIRERYIAGETLTSLAMDYDMPVREVKEVVRSTTAWKTKARRRSP